MSLYLGNNMIAGNSAQIDKVAQEIPLGASRYSGETLDANLGWVKSEGQWNSGSVYSTFYTTALSKIGDSFASGSIVASTDAYTDYDLVINTSDQTFRLPLKNGQEAMFATGVKGNGISLGLTNGTQTGALAYTNQSGWGSSTITGRQSAYGHAVGTSASGTSTFSSGDKTIGITTDTTKSGITIDQTSYTIPTGIYLYFKVANAVQNLALLDAAQVISAVNTVVPDNSSTIAGYAMPSNTYINLTLGASGTEYIAPANGYYYLRMTASGQQYMVLACSDSQLQSIIFAPASGWENGCWLPVKKGDHVYTYYSYPTVNQFIFIYAKGSESEAS